MKYFDASCLSGLNVVLVSANIDNKLLRSLSADLKQQGVFAWSLNDLQGGQGWKRELKKNIAEAHFVVILLTNNGAKERGELQVAIQYAIDEAMEVGSGQIFVIPITIDTVDTVSMGLPKPHSIEENGWEPLSDVFKHALILRDG